MCFPYTILFRISTWSSNSSFIFFPLWSKLLLSTKSLCKLKLSLLLLIRMLSIQKGFSEYCCCLIVLGCWWEVGSREAVDQGAGVAVHWWLWKNVFVWIIFCWTILLNPCLSRFHHSCTTFPHSLFWTSIPLISEWFMILFRIFSLLFRRLSAFQVHFFS